MPGSSRVVLLTGAAGGLGRVMTQALLADGHRVAAVDRDAGGSISSRPCPMPATVCSPSRPTWALRPAVSRRSRPRASRFGDIDAVINNAGIGMSAVRPDAEARHPGIEELSPDVFERFFAIFVRAPVAITRAALPLMKARGFGRMVNNTTSYLTMLRVLPYGAAKAAFESMSAVWAARARRQCGHGERAGARRADRHTADQRRLRLGSQQDAAAADHGRADPAG